MDVLDLVGPAWELLPLRIPTGWGVRWNGLMARRLADGRLEVSDSEDLLWLVTLPPSRGVYESGPGGAWRELSLDAGWYRNTFRVVLLDPDWDHVLASFSTPRISELLVCIEKWVITAPHGDLSPGR